MATNDILTIEEARAVIGITDETFDWQLAQANTAATHALEVKIGPVVIQTIVEYHDGGGWCFRLYEQPVESVNVVTEAQGTTLQVLTEETFGTAAANQYLYDTTTGQLHRRDSGYAWPWWSGQQNVKVEYHSGRYATTADVIDRYKEACAIVLRHNWGIDHGSGNQTFGAFDGSDGLPFARGFAVPNRALELVADERLIIGMA